MNGTRKIVAALTLVFSLALSSAFAAPVIAADGTQSRGDAQSLGDARMPRIQFVSYLETSGGASLIGDTFSPTVNVALGWQILPWFGLGSFGAVEPLSYVTGLVEKQEAWAYRYGTELVFTAFPHALIHPFLRATIGGVSVGYNEHSASTEDDRHEYIDQRSFAGSLSLGAELSVLPNLKVALRAGWRFTDGVDYLGLEDSDMSGPELVLAARFVCTTVWF